MTKVLGVGIIGCGNISAAYLKLAPLFEGIEMRACADINPAAAKARADEFGVRAETVEGLLAAPDIDMIVNLTVPAVHYQVSAQALDAGKHVYSEKPFVLSVEEGRDLAERAARKGLRVGSAPDTFLGGAHQLARSLIETGAVGRITGGTCHVLSPGMEHWHPNPDFFFKPGGGPILDLGPYYISNLVQLIGPVVRVTAMTSIPSLERKITSEPRNGEMITVETPTTAHAILEFENGALVTLGASWDVKAHGHRPMELYGTDASLIVPDPNFFGGTVELIGPGGVAMDLPEWDHPLGVPNQEHKQGMMANYRTAGLADMALAIIEDRPHRCSLEFALHVVDVMTAILHSGETGTFIRPATGCTQPAPLGIEEAAALLKQKD
ncbi:MAG: Gfo/Idh/MocA family oxidoreductase [Hoeflea sp.]|uniref:Gfo/Idh/MocA family protein n=1 Tax=Hoeflea sp. TaxID=1940281 RepID=UPI001DCBE6FB|nr:Gfo/Idh/MocA family oxidoreductase [Hoeflea sp.]MBU4531664.1 Gfo/Idh/MocA family oxidoreductase [Alphaproteobacteria bacterium]MBU4544521.1 Gfo/Idh/MocA family oxidoreductase [Alphaproteobacteria bacterium]MBU4552752.1 Gfo/Idh/MocA family oxidoreductase [Alphaproteobacteria bacterium]MBV1724940.1 Gfo/Idh/MocA family oxidoreductase [Hoeflea sp.]MBV1760960.1 Gfo/Idh/MocA family oxidoreductase [Hoeflea sp.]